MTHERARFILTMVGAVFPFLTFIATLVLFVFAPAWAPALAGLAVLTLILAVLLGIVSHIAIFIATVAWACGECGKRYFAYLMPYWPLDRDCQNCRLPD